MVNILETSSGCARWLHGAQVEKNENETTYAPFGMDEKGHILLPRALNLNNLTVVSRLRTRRGAGWT